MPTGYTAKLMESGQPFEEFAMSCARAFGALIMMRDDAMDAPIPEFEPSPYYEKSLTQHRAELARLIMMSEDERLAYGHASHAESIASAQEYLEKDIAENERLDAMRKQVLAWTPPTSEHQGLKDFMLEQIKISANALRYHYEAIAQAKSKTPLQYWTDAVAVESRGVEYATAELAKEIERTRGRNLWVKQLRESLVAQAV
jgi:hypothetical protein